MRKHVGILMQAAALRPCIIFSRLARLCYLLAAAGLVDLDFSDYVGHLTQLLPLSLDSTAALRDLLRQALELLLQPLDVGRRFPRGMETSGA